MSRTSNKRQTKHTLRVGSTLSLESGATQSPSLASTASQHQDQQENQEQKVLPDGWRIVASRSRPGVSVFLNTHTGERCTRRPHQPAALTLDRGLKVKVRVGQRTVLVNCGSGAQPVRWLACAVCERIGVMREHGRVRTHESSPAGQPTYKQVHLIPDQVMLLKKTTKTSSPKTSDRRTRVQHKSSESLRQCSLDDDEVEEEEEEKYSEYMADNECAFGGHNKNSAKSGGIILDPAMHIRDVLCSGDFVVLQVRDSSVNTKPASEFHVNAFIHDDVVREEISREQARKQRWHRAESQVEGKQDDVDAAFGGTGGEDGDDGSMRHLRGRNDAGRKGTVTTPQSVLQHSHSNSHLDTNIDGTASSNVVESSSTSQQLIYETENIPRFTSAQREIVRALNLDCLALLTDNTKYKSKSQTKSNITSANITIADSQAQSYCKAASRKSINSSGLLHILDSDFMNTEKPDQQVSTWALLCLHASCLDLIFDAFSHPIPKLLQSKRSQAKQERRGRTRKTTTKRPTKSIVANQAKESVDGGIGGNVGNTTYATKAWPMSRSLVNDVLDISIRQEQQQKDNTFEAETEESDLSSSSSSDVSDDSENPDDSSDGNETTEGKDTSEGKQQNTDDMLHNESGVQHERRSYMGTTRIDRHRQVVEYFTLRFTDFSSLIVRCGLLDSEDLKNKHVSMVFKAACARRKWCGPCDAPLTIRVDDFACALVQIARIKYKNNFHNNTTRQTALLLREIIVPFTRHVLVGAAFRQGERLSGPTLFVFHSALSELRRTFDRVCVTNGEAQLPVVLSRQQFVATIEHAGLLTKDITKRFPDAGVLFDVCTKYTTRTGMTHKSGGLEAGTGGGGECMALYELIEALVLLLGGDFEGENRSGERNADIKTPIRFRANTEHESREIELNYGTTLNNKCYNDNKNNIKNINDINEATVPKSSAPSLTGVADRGIIIDGNNNINKTKLNLNSTSGKRSSIGINDLDKKERSRLAKRTIGKFIYACTALYLNV